MTDGMKSGIAGAIVGAMITGIFSVGLFIAEKDSIEKKTIETLAGYFDFINVDMSYKEVLTRIYEDSKIVKRENEELKKEVRDLKGRVNTDTDRADSDKDKLTIENNNPKNMTDVVPAYQSGGNPYKEYSAQKSGSAEYFTMAGKKYTNGMTFNGDYNIFNDVSWALFNLEGKYKSLEFTVGHVDGSYLGDANTLQIFCDGVLKKEIPLSPDMYPEVVSFDVTGVSQLKLQILDSGGDNPLYGVGNPMIY